MAIYTIPISIRMEVEAASPEEAAEVAWQVAEAMPRRIVPLLTPLGIVRPEITVSYDKIAPVSDDQGKSPNSLSGTSGNAT